MSNGYLKPEQLTSIYGVQLANVTAQAFRNMSNACFAETGRYLSIALPAGGYRSFWLQGDMRTNPNRWSLYNLNPLSLVPLAQPGYSNHGLGLAVDVANWSVMKVWVLANMGRFGFSRPFGIRDPNHLLHNGRTTGHATGGTLTPAGTTKTPVTPPTVQEDDMAYIAPILEEKNGKIVATGDGYSGPNGFYFIANKEDKELLERDIEATRQSARGEPVKAQFLEGERIIVDGYKSGTRPRK